MLVVFTDPGKVDDAKTANLHTQGGVVSIAHENMAFAAAMFPATRELIGKI
jgi:hypothetical protein